MTMITEPSRRVPVAAEPTLVNDVHGEVDRCLAGA